MATVPYNMVVQRANRAGVSVASSTLDSPAVSEALWQSKTGAAGSDGVTVTLEKALASNQKDGTLNGRVLVSTPEINLFTDRGIGTEYPS